MMLPFFMKSITIPLNISPFGKLENFLEAHCFFVSSKGPEMHHVNFENGYVVFPIYFSFVLFFVEREASL